MGVSAQSVEGALCVTSGWFMHFLKKIAYSHTIFCLNSIFVIKNGLWMRS